jgi:DNA-binding LytR/AlgR family response regulator
MEEKLPTKSFMRVHKSFIINLEQIQSIRNQNITIAGHQVPVSDMYLESLMAWIER